VKAEPLVLLPGIGWALWRTRPSAAAFARELAVVAALAAAVLTPWTIRNYVHFDRFLPTAASGGIGVYLANHPGASGGQDLLANRALQERFRRENLAWTAIALFPVSNVLIPTGIPLVYELDDGLMDAGERLVTMPLSATTSGAVSTASPPASTM